MAPKLGWVRVLGDGLALLFKEHFFPYSFKPNAVATVRGSSEGYHNMAPNCGTGIIARITVQTVHATAPLDQTIRMTFVSSRSLIHKDGTQS